MITRHASHRQRRTLAWLLVLALLVAQAVGLIHRVVHAAGAPTQGPSHVQASSIVKPLQALFSQHRDSGDCSLFDQMSHADGLVAVHLDAGGGSAVTAYTPAPHPGWRLASQAAGFLARGPPPTL